MSTLCISLCVTLGKSLALGLCSFTVKQKGFTERISEVFHSSEIEHLSVPELSHALLLRFGVLQYVLNIGRNLEHSDLRKQETREVVWSPQPSVHSGVRAAERVKRGGGTRVGGGGGQPI